MSHAGHLLALPASDGDGTIPSGTISAKSRSVDDVDGDGGGEDDGRVRIPERRATIEARVPWESKFRIKKVKKMGYDPDAPRGTVRCR